MTDKLHGMTESYGDAANEYRQTREHAAFFDLSKRAKVSLIGPEAVPFLHNLCSNEVRNLQSGDGCEAFLTTAKAKIIAHIFVGNFTINDASMLLLDSEPGEAETILKHLDHYLISEQVDLADATDQYAMLHVCGPEAPEIAGDHLHIRKIQRIGLPGYDVLCAPDKIAQVKQQLIDKGVTQAGGQAYEWLRVEAGMPVFGRDMDANRFVMEVGRTEQAISFTKGCFLGQEPIVMARDRGQVNRRFVGIRFTDGDALSAGAKVMHDGQEVGVVTSSLFSPALQCLIALGYVKRGSHETGTKVDVDGRVGTIAQLPLVSPLH